MAVNLESSIILLYKSSTKSFAGLNFSLFIPGSPCIPIPISISSSLISKVGFPASGKIQGDTATPSVRILLLTSF
ncbi:uncharacterized protein METZ01_LOCUS224759, partial [marine metagenome]